MSRETRTIAEIHYDAHAHLVRRLVGKGHDEAIELVHFFRLRSRTVSIDGQHAVVTRDHRTDRVNLEVERGRVTKAYLG